MVHGRFTMGTNKELTKERVRQNAQQLDILSADDLVQTWMKVTGKPLSEVTNPNSAPVCWSSGFSTVKTSANLVAPAMDAVLATRLMRDLGLTGRAVVKVVKGKTYVIFKGYAGTRSIFTGTRYLAMNPKVVDMAIGKLGVAKSVVKGARLTVFLVVPINVLQYILDDQKTMSDLIGTTATDLVKVGLATAIAGLAGAATATVTTLAAGPLIVAIAVGVAVGFTLDALDRQFSVTEKLIKALDELSDSTFGEAARAINQLENTLRWQATQGIPVGRGIFY